MKRNRKNVPEETLESVTLAGRTFPIEIDTDERIAEFQKNNEEVLKKYSFKKRRCKNRKSVS
ncbi:MAG: hypothetical protein UY50_C0036G0005 [Parcubacteria group bacterium GW2011_GWA2_49_9]|nr:MAG: hypothetical protein UY50_C0036G0005 [Parcubacteria group bacterium GW2011_GWA2_49_9]